MVKHALHLIVMALLFMGPVVGCAPAVSGEGRAAMFDTDAVSLAQTSTVVATKTPTPAPSATPPPAKTPAPAPTDTFLLASPTASIPTRSPAATPISATPSASKLNPTDTPVAAAVVASATTPVVPTVGATNAEELLTYGLEVYGRQYCGACHQLGAAGTGGMFGPTHDSMATIAEQRIREPGYAGTATTAEEYIYESIVSPGAYTVPGYEVTSHRMPAYIHLEEGDLNALVHMLLQQR